MPTGGFVGIAPTTRTSGDAGAASIFLTAVVAQQNGTVDALLIDTPSATASTTFKALVYDSAHSVLLASSAQVTSIAAGYNRVPLTSRLNVTAGTTYYIGYVCSTSLLITIQSGGGTSWYVSGGQSVTTPPNPLASGVTNANLLMGALELDGAGTSGFGFSADQAAGVVLSSRNRVATCPAGTANRGARSLVTQVSGTGKWYAEVLVGGTLGAGNTPGIGIASADWGTAQGPAIFAYAGFLLPSGVTANGVNLGLSYVVGDVIGIAYDAVNNLLWWNKNNGSWFGASSTAGNPATGAGGAAVTAGTQWPFSVSVSTAAGAATVYTLRDTAGELQYAPPSGFSSWSSATILNSVTVSGVTREALITSPGQVYLSSVAREALIAGTGILGQAGAQSSLQGRVDVIQYALTSLAAQSSLQGYLVVTPGSGVRAKSQSSLQAELTITGGIVNPAGGAGGGGAAGLYGPGEFGQTGQYDGTGGYGGAGDDNFVPRQTNPSSTGFSGTEWNGTTGSGSGGSGGSWGGSGHGGNGGVGGTYGGGGGGGGAGLSGGGLGALGGNGAIYLEYDPGTGPVYILLTSTSGATFTIPADWNMSNNTVLIVGAGGCGKNGGLTTGGGGGGGGSVVGAINTDLYTPGQVIAVDIPTAAQVCAGVKGNTVFGSNSAPPGINGDGTTGGTPAVPIDPSHGGFPSGGGTTGGGAGGPGTGGPGGGTAQLITGRIEAKSYLAAQAAADLNPRQYAVSVQTWHY